MVEIEKLEDLCKSQYGRFLDARNYYDELAYYEKDISFDHVEQRGDFLIASCTEEKENPQRKRKENSAVYFVVPYKDGKVGDDTLLIEACSCSGEYKSGGRCYVYYGEDKAALTIRQAGDEIARITFSHRSDDLHPERQYFDFTDKKGIAEFISTAHINPKAYYAMRTRDDKEYLKFGPAHSDRLEREDLRISLRKISKAFESFIGSEGDLKKEEKRLLNEDFKGTIAAFKARLKAPFREISNAVSLSKERAKNRKEKTVVIPRSGGRS